MKLKTALKNINDLWNEAKKRCHIGDEEVKIAKELDSVVMRCKI